MAKMKKGGLITLLGIIILVAGLLLLTFVSTWIGIVVMVVGAVIAIVFASKSKKKK